MRLRFLAPAALILASTLACHADTIKGSATFTDTTSNNTVNFSGTFANPSFSFTGSTYTDSLTIDPSYFLFGGTDNLQVALAFTLPNPASGNLNGTGTISFSGFFDTEHNSIDWNNGGLATVDFADGTVLTASLADFDFTGSSAKSENLTLTQTPGVSPVPEPGSLALLGTGVLAAAGMIRRRLMA